MGNRESKTIWKLLGLMLLGGVCGAAIRGLDSWLPVGLTAELGAWLRRLSLSGPWGNGAAWGMTVGISALPALGLLWRPRRRADWLLALAGAELFAGLYFLVNPGLLDVGMPQEAKASMWGMAAMGCVAGTLAAWALLRLLAAAEGRSSRLLPRLLRVCAALFAWFSGLGAALSLFGQLGQVGSANTDPVVGTQLILVLLTALELVPALLAAMVLCWGAGLAAALEAAPFSGETVELAERVAQGCGFAVKVSLAVCLAGNLLQLVLFKRLRMIQIHVALPLLSAGLALGLSMLCRYFRRAKAVSDDNDAII